MKPLFSIVLISKNEENTLPKCLDSLEEFRQLGGEIILADTGSTDRTVEIANQYGCKVFNINATVSVSPKMCDAINKQLDERDLLVMPSDGVSIFDFASARNQATAMATNDFIISLDCDEVYTSLDIEAINKLIESGVDQLDYQFIYAHNEDGSPSMQFRQSKAFNRNKLQWRGVIHEVLHTTERINSVSVTEDVIKLEHWQEPGKESRGKYLLGLAYDCYINPDNDRNKHYYARELMYQARPYSAIKHFEEHIQMDKWDIEKAQSYTYIGDCYGMLDDEQEQMASYAKAIIIDPNRAEPFVKSAWAMLTNGSFKAAIGYAKAAQEVDWTDYYQNHISHYTDEPHRIMYLAYGYIGNISMAQYHINKCLWYKPNDPYYLDHRRYYFND